MKNILLPFLIASFTCIFHLKAGELILTRNANGQVTEMSLPSGQKINYRWQSGKIIGKTFSGFKYTAASNLNGKISRKINGYHAQGSELFNYGLLNELSDYEIDVASLNDIFQHIAKKYVYNDTVKEFYETYFTTLVHSAAPNSPIFNHFNQLQADIANLSNQEKIARYLAFFFTKENAKQSYFTYLKQNIYTDVQQVDAADPDLWSDFYNPISECSPFAKNLIEQHKNSLYFSQNSIIQEQGGYLFLVDPVFSKPHIFVAQNVEVIFDEAYTDQIYMLRNEDISYKRSYFRDYNFDIISNLKNYNFPYRQFIFVHETMHVKQYERIYNEGNLTKFLISVLDSMKKYNTQFFSDYSNLDLFDDLRATIVQYKGIDNNSSLMSEPGRRAEYGAQMSALDMLIGCGSS